MQRIRYYYLIKLQYLGFRFHGWQKQPDVITVERMVERTVAFVLGRKNFKLLASGRTDAKVSVNQTYVELFVDEVIGNVAEIPVVFQPFLAEMRETAKRQRIN